VTVFFEVISKSAMHIYHTALVLTPETSTVRRIYGSHARPLVRIVHGAPHSWDLSIAGATRPSGIDAAAWSPCGSLIAIARNDGKTVEILDAPTLQCLYTMDSPPSERRGLVFSPGGRFLACSGLYSPAMDPDYQIQKLLSPTKRASFVMAWDTQTGGTARVIWFDVPVVLDGDTLIVYSPDGGMLAALYDWGLDSASNKFVICVCDIVIGDPVVSSMFYGKPMSIWIHERSVRFAVNHLSGGITVWEVKPTPKARAVQVQSIPTPEGAFSDCPLFSSDRSRVAYIRGITGVLVWDIEGSRTLLEFNDRHFINHRMSFSPDGRFFACETRSGDLCLWRASRAGYSLHQKITTTSSPAKWLFSPDLRSILTWGHTKIQLWDVEDPTTDSCEDAPEITRNVGRFTAAFSSDDTWVAVAQRESLTVTVLDLVLGVPQLLINADEGVIGLQFTKDGIIVIGIKRATYWKLSAGKTVDGSAGPRLAHFSDRTKTAFCWEVSEVTSDTSDEDIDLFTDDPWDDDPWENPTEPNRPLKPTSRPSRVAFSLDTTSYLCDVDTGAVEVDRKALHSFYGPPSDAEAEPFLTGTLPHSNGYGRITNDGWLLNRNERRLMLLPHRWRLDESALLWGGRFVLLMEGLLPIPVILELKE